MLVRKTSLTHKSPSTNKQVNSIPERTKDVPVDSLRCGSLWDYKYITKLCTSTILYITNLPTGNSSEITNACVHVIIPFL